MINKICYRCLGVVARPTVVTLIDIVIKYFSAIILVWLYIYSVTLAEII